MWPSQNIHFQQVIDRPWFEPTKPQRYTWLKRKSAIRDDKFDEAISSEIAHIWKIDLKQTSFSSSANCRARIWNTKNKFGLFRNVKNLPPDKAEAVTLWLHMCCIIRYEKKVLFQKTMNSSNHSRLYEPRAVQLLRLWVTTLNVGIKVANI
jgi:hypothetical protein